MGLACLVTLLAIAGIAAGVTVGRSRALPSHMAAAGGGLLFGIALFWVMPEIAQIFGWIAAVVLPILAAAAMLLTDRTLVHAGDAGRHPVIAPLLAATAVHSFLDGWSLRALAAQPLAGVAVPVGLALHKVPEGLALGWIAHRATASIWRAGLAAGAVELCTLVGAYVEPRADLSGSIRFGPWWSAAVLGIISGSFLFLGMHAVLPSWRRPGVLLVFLVSFGCVALVRH